MKPIPGLNKALQHKTRQLAGEAFVRIRDEAEAQYRRMLSSFYSAGLPEDSSLTALFSGTPAPTYLFL